MVDHRGSSDDFLWRSFVDLAAERTVIGAERGSRKIAVEIQSFLSPSPVRDLEEAVGQFAVYRTLLARSEPDRVLYLAVPNRFYKGLLSEPFGRLVVEDNNLRMLVFEKDARIVKWID